MKRERLGKVKRSSKKKKPDRVYVGLSGGVDSSVAAALLKEQGYEVTGVHLICWRDENNPACTAERERADAERVAASLDIPFKVWDLTRAYRRKVFAYMVREYRLGLTPNPDVACNREIKFGVFLERALKEGADYVATGHYVRLRRSRIISKAKNYGNKLKEAGEVFRLYQARDRNKDQSYWLWTLKQEQLRRVLFPLGDYLKSEVREMAREINLPTAMKRDSQGLCFVGRVNFREFMESYLKAKTGVVVTAAGEVVGRHRGVDFYTIGQRRGLGIWGGGEIYYVAAKDRRRNKLMVVPAGNVELEAMGVRLRSVNLIRKGAPERVWARTRYRQLLTSAERRGEKKLIFREPVTGVAPGQSAVFYSRMGELLGGGIIERVLKTRIVDR